MPVPEEIRRVQRPPNTSVVDTGKDSPNRYCVREVVKVVGKDGKVARTPGKVIGHIRDLVFVPESGATRSRHALPYGNAAMVHEEAREILGDLTKCFPLGDACKIAAIAMLRVLFPGATQRNLADRYKHSYLSVLMPGIPLSQTTVSKFVQDIGQFPDAIREFYALRLDKIAETHLVLVGAVHKEETSKIDSIYQYSLKSAKKGMPEISVLYAYDADAEEPICVRAHEQRHVDSRDYSYFVRTHDLGRGAVVVDEELPTETAKDIASGNAGLHFISRLDRHEQLVQDHAMFTFEGALPEFSGVLYKKVAVSQSLFLYSFCDIDKKYEENEAYLESTKKGKFDADEYHEKEPSFGTTIFASDLDLPPLKVYKAHLNKWRIKVMLRLFRQDIVPNTPSVWMEAAIAGCEFINLVSALITARLVKKFDSLGWFRDRTYGDIMDDLAHVKRYDDAPRFQLPDKDDRYWEVAEESLIGMLVEAGLCTNKFAEPPRRGRPRKEPAATDEPKRPRGRPKSAKNLEREALEAEMLTRGEVPVKRPPGRPKGSRNKSTLEREAQIAEMRVRGELPPKRSPGRPKGSKNRKTLEREALENASGEGMDTRRMAEPDSQPE